MKFNICILVVITLISFSTNIFSQNYITVTVKKGDTLWDISKKYLKDPFRWHEIQKLNNIGNPEKLTTGTKIRIPTHEFKSSLAIELKEIDKPREAKQPRILDDRLDQLIKKVEKISPADNVKNLIAETDKIAQKVISKKDILDSQETYMTAMEQLEKAREHFYKKEYEQAKESAEKSKNIFSNLQKLISEKKIKQSPLRLTFIKGLIEFYDNIEQKWIRILTPNTEIYGGSKLRTSSLSTAILVSEDGSVFRLNPNSQIELTTSYFSLDKNILIIRARLNLGSFTINRNEKSPIKTEFQCKTENIDISSNGFLKINLTEKKEIRCENYFGESVLNINNEELYLKSGYGILIYPGLPPSKPQRLSESVILEQPVNNTFFNNSTPVISFHPINDNSKYRVEISEDEKFYSMVFDEITDKTSLKVNALLDGRYYWRVTAVDSKGFHGFPGEFRSFVIDTIGPRLVVFNPVEDEILNNKYVKIEGITEPNLKIQLNQFIILPNSAGEFNYTLPFNQGTNAISILVKDNAGNITKTTRIFHVDYNSQIKKIKDLTYSVSPYWSVNTFNIKGQIIFNDIFYEVEYGLWSKELNLKQGKNTLILSLPGVSYKEFNIIFDNEKPEVKSLQIIPYKKNKSTFLKVALTASEKFSGLKQEAILVLRELENASKKYSFILNYDSLNNQYNAEMEIPPKLLKKELVISHLEIEDIIGNKLVISEKDIEQQTMQGTPFWDKLKTNFKSLGLPAFILSGGGIILSL